jgi:hypothetical protein
MSLEQAALAMVFKLVDAAQKSWCRLDGRNQLPKVIKGVKFTDWLDAAASSADGREPQIAAA